MSATAAPAPPGVYVPPARGTRESLMLNIGFFAMVIGMFMAILDIQIVASSIQKIQAGVSASAEEIAWIQTSYLIAEVIGIPLSGLLNRALSMRRLFVYSAAGFTVSSMMCALAWDLNSVEDWGDLVEYLYGDASTHWGAVRIHNDSHPAPYKIDTFELGALPRLTRGVCANF